MRHATLKPRPMLMPLLILTMALCLMLACTGPTPPTQAPPTEAPVTEAPATQTPSEEEVTDTPSATEAPSATVTAPDTTMTPGKAGETPPSQPTEPPSNVVRFGPDPTLAPDGTDAEPATGPEPSKLTEGEPYLENAHLPPGSTPPGHSGASPDEVPPHLSIASGTEHAPPLDLSKSSDGTVEHSDSSAAGIPTGDPEGHRSGRPRVRHPEQITAPQAGEIDDNDDWETYLAYEAAYSGPPVSRTALQGRYVITVTDDDGLPVHGATIVVEREDGTDHRTYRTHADGRAIHHHPRPLQQDQTDPHEVLVFTVISGDATANTQTSRTPSGTHINITLPRPQDTQGPTSVDVLFLLDSTGSMSDEIERIKETLTSIAKRVRNLPGNPDLRMGMVSYRDRGDKYVNRLYDFDSDDRRFSRTVRGVQAHGGGDYSEALTEALHVAVTKPTWRHQSVKLIFLIADAPPQDYDNQLHYTTELARAQEQGIKIFAVASSGLDEQGEFIFRQFAQQTMGRFIFILYDHGPQRELTTPHEVGDDYTVERLDRLIVRLITAELQSITTPTQSPLGQN